MILCMSLCLSLPVKKPWCPKGPAVCVYVCMYVVFLSYCMCVGVCVYVVLCLYACVYVCVYMYVCTCVCIYMYIEQNLETSVTSMQTAYTAHIVRETWTQRHKHTRPERYVVVDQHHETKHTPKSAHTWTQKQTHKP